MSEKIITLTQLFGLRGESAKKADPAWRSKLGAELNQELKGIKWPTALPDVSEKLCELLDLPLTALFVGAWKKMDDLRRALKETVGKPDEKCSVKLFEHTLDSTFEPSLQVRLWKLMPLPKELKFPVHLEGTFRGLRLEIENGAIARICGGECDVAGTLSLGKTPLAKKDFGTLQLTGDLFELDEKPRAIA